MAYRYPGPCVLDWSQVLFFHHDLRPRALTASRRPVTRTATYLTTTWPFTLAMSCTHPHKPALPNKLVTKARTRFRSHPLDPRSQLDGDRFPLQVTAKPCVDATMSEPTSVTNVAAAVLAAASVRGWGRFRGSRNECSGPLLRPSIENAPLICPVSEREPIVNGE